jgi:hypothetical protein
VGVQLRKFLTQQQQQNSSRRSVCVLANEMLKHTMSPVEKKIPLWELDSASAHA